MSGQQQSQMDFSHHAAEAATPMLRASYLFQVTMGDNVEFLTSQKLFCSSGSSGLFLELEDRFGRPVWHQTSTYVGSLARFDVCCFFNLNSN